MINELGFQLYTIRDYLADAASADEAFSTLKNYGYTEVHTFKTDVYPELLSKHGISVIGTHYFLDKILNDPQTTIKQHKEWNTTNIGISSLPPHARFDLQEIKTFVKKYNAAASIYAQEGFKLTYHNHQFEFMRIDGYKTTMDILYEELDPKNISFVLDTCWVAAGGSDVIDWMDKLKGRIDILHLKDTCIIRSGDNYVTDVTEVGNGNLSWDKIIQKAEEIGVKHYVVEQDRNWTNTSLDSLKISANFLEKYRK